MRCMPTTHELYCCLLYIVVNVVTYTLTYHIILNSGDPQTVRIRTNVLIFGGIQSTIGFAAGLCVVKLLYSPPLDEAELEEVMWA
jgi:hypothetical protein